MHSIFVVLLLEICDLNIGIFTNALCILNAKHGAFVILYTELLHIYIFFFFFYWVISFAYVNINYFLVKMLHI